MVALTRQVSRVVAVSLVACLAVGCASYRATISVRPTADAAEGAPISDADRSRAQEALSHVVREQGLVVSPEFENVARASRDDPNWKEEVIALYVTSAWGVEGLEVVSAVDKGTGQYRVAIVQYGSPWPSEAAKALEAAVLRAIQQELGSQRVQINRRKGGPSLSP